MWYVTLFTQLYNIDKDFTKVRCLSWSRVWNSRQIFLVLPLPPLIRVVSGNCKEDPLSYIDCIKVRGEKTKSTYHVGGSMKREVHLRRLLP